MSDVIDRLITAYESGAFTRRQLLTALAAIGVGGRALSAEQQQSAPGSSVARLNHVNLRVSDLERSVAFYQKLFGPGFRQFPTMLPFDLGSGSMVPYMSVQTHKDVATEGRHQYSPRWLGSLTTQPGTWEHIAFEVDDLDHDRTMATLEAEGVEATNSAGIIWTHDPDGALIQIVETGSRGATLGESLEPITPEDIKKHD